MKSSGVAQGFKLAAVDLDGTLLGPDRKISPENARAVQQLQRSGLQVVLASGRHYHNMRRYAEALPGVQWLVSCQGGESSDIARDIILNREFLAPAEAAKILEMGRAQGVGAVIYTVDRIYTVNDWNADLAFYSDLSGCEPLRVPARELLGRPVFKIIWMGPPSQIEQLAAQEIVLPETQMVRTHDRLLEIMPARVTKATGLQWIATRLGLKPATVMAFGDGDNDVPMFEWAGASFAMAHGWPSALRRAAHITPAGPPETAFARGVGSAFQMGFLSARN